MKSMDLKTVKGRIETAHTLATIPAVAKHLLELVANPTVSITEISSFISSDPALTARVLMMVNSPVYGFPGRISSVNQAVLLLGLNVVKGLVFGVTVFDLMQQAMIGLWEHSLGCAILSRLIAKKKGLQDPEEASVYGLLHDVGKVFLVIRFPEEYQKVMREAEEKGCTVYEVESGCFSTTHATVGAWIAEQWRFPAPLIDAIRYHHKPHLSKSIPVETAIVHFADVLLRGKGFGFAGDSATPALQPSAWELLDLSEGDIKDMLREAEGLLEEVGDLSL
jgi:putative nucleotidyltransferase with HDIG domain